MAVRTGAAGTAVTGAVAGRREATAVVGVTFISSRILAVDSFGLDSGLCGKSSESAWPWKYEYELSAKGSPGVAVTVSSGSRPDVSSAAGRELAVVTVATDPMKGPGSGPA